MAQFRRRVEQEPAFVLHTYPYKETSLIVEAFSRSQGRTALDCKGREAPALCDARGAACLPATKAYLGRLRRK